MAKKSGKAASTVTHKDIHHGKKIGGKNAKGEMHMKTLMKHKGAKMEHSPQVEGHVDHQAPNHDAKKHAVGSRGPWNMAAKGKHKAK